jgi:hypothetical protein
MLPRGHPMRSPPAAEYRAIVIEVVAAGIARRIHAFGRNALAGSLPLFALSAHAGPRQWPPCRALARHEQVGPENCMLRLLEAGSRKAEGMPIQSRVGPVNLSSTRTPIADGGG